MSLLGSNGCWVFNLHQAFMPTQLVHGLAVLNTQLHNLCITLDGCVRLW